MKLISVNHLESVNSHHYFEVEYQTKGTWFKSPEVLTRKVFVIGDSCQHPRWSDTGNCVFYDYLHLSEAMEGEMYKLVNREKKTQKS